MSDVQKEIKRISKLKQYQKKDKTTLEAIAQINVWKRHVDLESRFSKTNDKHLAKKFFDNYLSNYTISSYTDVQNLVDLVYEEVMLQKTQIEIDKMTSDENSKFVPTKQVETLHNIQDRIWVLKEKIGIIKNDKKDDLTALQELEKKFTAYAHFNRNEFTLYTPYKCAGCGREDVEPLLLRRRVKDFDIYKHPAFSGRFLYNPEIIKDVKKGLITKEQAARYLVTSESYINWVIKNEKKKIYLDGITQDTVDKLVNNNPHLRKASYYNE